MSLIPDYQPKSTDVGDRREALESLDYRLQYQRLMVGLPGAFRLENPIDLLALVRHESLAVAAAAAALPGTRRLECPMDPLGWVRHESLAVAVVAAAVALLETCRLESPLNLLGWVHREILETVPVRVESHASYY